MKSIKDTFIFKMQDQSFGLKKKMLSYDSVLDDVDLKLIDEQLHTIQKRFNGYPARNIILNHVGDTIIPIYNKDRIKLPSSLPAYLFVKNAHSSAERKVVALVNLTNFSKMDRNKEYLTIEPRQLFGLLQTGEVLMTCHKKWNSISMSQEICKIGSLIYSRIFIKVLDKMFAVNFDPIKADKIKFIASKFFLLNMIEKTSSGDIIDNMAYANCNNGTTRNTINAFNEELNPKIYEDFGNLIQQIALEIDGLGNLTVRTFLDCAVSLYGQSIPLAFEYFPMFLHMVFSVVIGARFNNEFVLESVIGKEADKLYSCFVNLIRE